MQLKPISSPIASRPLRRGSVIVLVLLTVFLAAFLLAKFVQRAGTEMLADARAADQARLRREAYSALEVTLAVLADFRANDGGLRSPAQGWDDPLDYAGYQPEGGRTVQVEYEDESGKLSLPGANAAALQNLLQQIGLARAEAELTTDALLGWTLPEHLAASPETDPHNYERRALPHGPALRPLRTFAELASIEYARDFFFDPNGEPTEIFRAFRASVSLYSFSKINLNTASPAALAAAGIDANQSEAMRAHTARQAATGGTPFFNSVNEATPLLGANAPLNQLGVEVSALRIKITVRDGVATYRLEAVIAPPGGATLAPAPKPLASDEKTPSATAPAPATTPTANTNTKKLDYPFKVLEIVEDAAASDPVETQK